MAVKGKQKYADTITVFAVLSPEDRAVLLADLQRFLLTTNVIEGTETPARMTERPTLCVVKGGRQ